MTEADLIAAAAQRVDDVETGIYLRLDEHFEDHEDVIVYPVRDLAEKVSVAGAFVFENPVATLEPDSGLAEIEDRGFDDYPNEAIGGGNPYYRCCACHRSDPEINGRLLGHLASCSWRLGKEEELRRQGQVVNAPASREA